MALSKERRRLLEALVVVEVLKGRREVVYAGQKAPNGAQVGLKGGEATQATREDLMGRAKA